MRKVFIQLTGGLGNQLFQYSAGLSLSVKNNSELIFEQDLAKPRGSIANRAEILSFQLPRTPQTLNSSKLIPSPFMARVVGYALRTGIKPNKFESMQLIKKIQHICSAILISIFVRFPIRLQIGRGVGYSKLLDNHTNTYLIGYFQSYRYAQANKELLQEIGIHPIEEELEFYTEISTLEMPLVVHCRFGDYLKEKDFGIPSAEYYQNAIHEIRKKRDFRSIWVFSDDLELAAEKLNLGNELPIRWINTVDNSITATIQAMRLGYGYVIANSSFSWWAAFLSHQSDANVIAPKPWFMNLESPFELIPPNWTEIDAGYHAKH